MKNQDKIIAIGGVALIIILAVLAVVLLMRVDDSSASIVKLNKNNEPVQVRDIPVADSTESGQADAAEDTGPQVQTAGGAAQSDNAVNEVLPDAATVENEYYEKSVCREVRNNDDQMAELYGYWNEYQLDAVGDLIRLERVRMLTKSLAGSNEFYYYGETDTGNIPNGKGLAIYKDDTYYFGDWVKGLRNGDGMWLKIYPDKAAKVGAYTGVLEHQYNGQFKGDLPFGNGQEHYTYEVGGPSGELCIANVIGGFKNGYYNGELYIMTIESNGSTRDWYGEASDGSLLPREANKISTTGKKPVLSKGEDNDHSTDESDDGYYWMSDNENRDLGIFGLKKTR